MSRWASRTPTARAERALTHAGKGERHLDAQFSPERQVDRLRGRDEDASSRCGWSGRDGSDDHRLPVGCKDPCLGVGTPTWVSNKTVLFVTR